MLFLCFSPAFYLFVVLPCSASVQRISHVVVLSHLESSSMVSSTERVATNRILTATWCRLFFWPTSWVNVTLPKFNMEPHFMKISKIRRSIFPFQRLDFSGKNPERFNIPKTSSKYLAEVRPTSGRVFEVQSHASKCRLKDLDFPSEMAIFQKASKSQVHKKMGMVYTYRFVYDSCSATGGRCFFFCRGLC